MGSPAQKIWHWVLHHRLTALLHRERLNLAVTAPLWIGSAGTEVVTEKVGTETKLSAEKGNQKERGEKGG